MQSTKLRYAIKFVADMDKAVKFHRDVLGLKVKFESRVGASSRRARPLWLCTRLPIKIRQAKWNWVSLSLMSRLFTGI